METPEDTLPTRDKIPVNLTWDPTLVFKTEADWETEFARVEGLIPQFAAYKGRMPRSGRLLLEGLKLRDEIEIAYGKLNTYVSCHGDADTANAHYQALRARLEDLATEYGTATAWLENDLLRIKPERLAKWMDQFEGLGIYRKMFRDLALKARHVRSHEVEEVLALGSKTASGPQTIYNMFCDADMTFPSIKDETGKTVEVTHGSFGALLENQDRAVREAAFRSCLGTYEGFKNAFAAMYIAQVKQDVFAARVRNYGSAIEKELSGINVPVSVYDNLVSATNANLDKLHRYLSVRKKLLGVDKLNFWDLYVPLYHMKVTYDEAKKMVLEAVAVFGPQYVSVVERAFNERWVDVMENKGKVSGAYSGGSYGTPPYMLMNWQDTLGEAYTLAHEAGHSLHTWHAHSTQPYATAGYNIFTAETASTVNEALMTHIQLKNAKTREERKFILNQYLDGFRGTFFRQTLFAEFEKIIHAKEEAGEPLTVKAICAVYQELCTKYYGAVVEIDPLIAIEWARIPHFYNSFYVYQYATGISAATVLSAQVLEEGAPAVERYLNFLRSGGNDDAIELLKKAGADLSDPATIQKALDVFGKYVEEFEALSTE